jgi:two-component system chemotaxis sensor kinase CheA
MDELTREFLIESQEGLDRMERCLTDLETSPQDAALLGDIFRSVHTVKGTTGFLGFKRLEELAHSGENLLGLLRDGKLVADRPIITGLLHLLDGLRLILKSIETEGSEGEGEDTTLIEQLEELQAPAHASAKQAVRVRAGAQSAGAPSSESRAAAHVPVARPPALEGQPVPTLLSPTPEAAEAAPPLAAKGPVSEAEADASRARGQASGSAAESSLRVDVVLLNRMMNLVGELVLTRSRCCKPPRPIPT